MKTKIKNAIKTSFRFYDGKEVRSVWDDETSSWMICATDIIAVLANSKEPRKYWYAMKKRHGQLSTNCRQLKLIKLGGHYARSDNW